METIGYKLKAAREKIKLSRADVAKAVRINTQYVEAIENNEFHKLIAPIYAKGFIKLYAQCVQLDPAPLMCQFSALEVSVELSPAGRKLPDKKEVFSFRSVRVNSQKRRRFLNVRLAALLDVIKKIIKRIKLPEISQSSLPSLKPLEAPVKKWLAIIIVAAVLCAVILPVLIKHMTASNASLRVPPACRWIAEPPEPYLNIPAPKSQNSR